MKYEETYAYPKWIYHGLGWGAFMFVIMQLLIPFAQSEAITLKSLLIGVVIWSAGGLMWGYLMHIFYGRSKIKPDDVD